MEEDELSQPIPLGYWGKFTSLSPFGFMVQSKKIKELFTFFESPAMVKAIGKKKRFFVKSKWGSIRNANKTQFLGVDLLPLRCLSLSVLCRSDPRAERTRRLRKA